MFETKQREFREPKGNLTYSKWNRWSHARVGGVIVEKLDRELKIIENAIERLGNIEIPINRVDQLKDINLFTQVILDNINSIKEQVKHWIWLKQWPKKYYFH